MAKHRSKEEDTIKVLVRVRPSDSKDEDSFFTVCHEKASISVPSKSEPKYFSYDSVAGPESTQDEIFSYSGKVLVDQIVSGYNGALFAYGQTGSGKTFSMMGPGFDETSESLKNASRGVIPRSLEYLFASINSDVAVKEEDAKTFLVKTTFLEIYNEQIYDLLEPSQRALHLRESLQRGVFVEGLVEKSVTSPNEAFESLMRGMANRRVASTTMNRESSRSHAVFTLHLESKETKDGLLKVKKSHLHLVDLAGSERQKDTKSDGLRLKEAGSINRSLATLGKVIMALVDVSNGKKRFIHYRDSKLTFMLRDSLGGNSKTFVIACIHPGTRFCEEGLSTLQFASHVKLIKNKAVVNEDIQGNVAKLKEEICHLKAELTRLTHLTAVPVELAAGKPAASGEDADGTGESRKRFLDSMALWKVADGKLRSLNQQLRTANDLNAQQEKIIRARDLVIKFRDSTIQRLSGKESTSKEAVDAEEAAQLHREIESLAKIEGCAPLKYLQENHRLRQALEEARVHMKEETRYREEVAHQLRTEFDRLLEEGAVEEAYGYLKEAKIKSDVETGKSQEHLAELQKDNRDLRCQLSELEELRRKEKLELTAEIAALKKTVEENERLRLSRLLRTNAERESLHDRQMRTLRTLTPTRPRTIGRSKLVSPMELPPPFEASPAGILEVTPPQESTVAVLSLELREEQEQSSQYRVELEKLQEEVGKLQAGKSKVQFTADQLQADLADTLNKLNRKEFELESAEEDLRFHQSKAFDTQVLLEASDRELTAAKSRVKAVETENARILELLGTTEHRAAALAADLEEAFTEKDSLQATNDSLRTSLAVFEVRAGELEKQLHAARSQLTDVNLQTDKERDNLELSLKEKTSALEKAMSDCEVLETRIVQLERAREADQNVLGLEIQRLTSERDSLTEALAEEASRLSEASELCEQRTALAAERLASLDEACRELEATRTESARREVLLLEATQAAVSLQGDLAEHEERTAELQEALLQNQVEVSDLKEKVEQKEAQLRDLTAIVQDSDRNDAQEVMRLEYELASRESRIQELVNSNASFENLIEEKNKDLQNLVRSLEDANRNRRSLEEDLHVSQRVCDESRSTMLAYRENMKLISSYLAAKKRENKQILDENNELELRMSLISRERSNLEKLVQKKEADIGHFQEALDDTRDLYNRQLTECERLRDEISNSEVRISHLENEKEEMLLLIPKAGHMNHKQKIHYIDNLRDEVMNLKQRNESLSQEVLVLTGRLRNYEPPSSRYLRDSDRPNQTS